MNRSVPIRSIRHTLQQELVGGHPLGSDSISELYAKVVSANYRFPLSSSRDWVTISYVQTSSAHGSGGMPHWVAEEAEQILEALLGAKVLESRAVWFDKLGMKQCHDWPAIATLNCIATPVICIPPTRTLEYSRFQVPDRWDTATYGFFTRVEELLRSCSLCGPHCPLEYDSRLLNIAAALRAWPINEAIMASSSCGAFISFATLDRIQYTIAWYQVLLHLALKLGNYDSEVHARSIELFGKALFEPCQHCMSLAMLYSAKEEEHINFHLLDDALSTILLQANRFCLPRAQEHEGQYLWSLDGLQRSPGEAYLRGVSNRQRLLKVVRRKVLSQSNFDEIAANIIRGRPALSSCYRNGDKWLCGLILSNLEKFILPLRSPQRTFDEGLRLQVLRLLKLERPFAELSYEASWMDLGGDRSTLSPICDGQQGSMCLFNELSGVLDPSSVAEFIRDRHFSSEERLQILTSAKQSLRRRIHVQGVAFRCYELKNGAVRECVTGRCGGCFKLSGHSGLSRKKMILVGWEAKRELSRSAAAPATGRHDDKVYSFITVDLDDSCHVRSRGTFSRSQTISCKHCRSTYVRVSVEHSNDLLEVHVSKALPIARALNIVYDALKRCHTF